MATLAPGIYRLRYRITGIFEVVAIQEGDLRETLYNAVKTIDAIDPVSDKAIKLDRKNMIVSVFIEVRQPVKLSDWNNAFENKFNQVLSWFYRFVQNVELNYIDHQKISKQAARQQIEDPGIIGETKNYLFWLVIGAVGVYALASSLPEFFDNS